jgi:hypothetical protein
MLRESNRFIPNALSHEPSSLSYNPVYAYNPAIGVDDGLLSSLCTSRALRLPILEFPSRYIY